MSVFRRSHRNVMSVAAMCGLAGLPLRSDAAARCPTLHTRVADVTRAVLFLVADEAGFISGEVLDLNGAMWCD